MEEYPFTIRSIATTLASAAFAERNGWIYSISMITLSASVFAARANVS
jgi:hypothetical protein